MIIQIIEKVISVDVLSGVDGSHLKSIHQNKRKKTEKMKLKM